MQLSSRRFLSLLYGGLVAGLTADKRAEIDELLEPDNSQLVSEWEAEGFSREAAQVRAQLSRATTIDDKVRLRMKLDGILSEQRGRPQEPPST